MSHFSVLSRQSFQFSLGMYYKRTYVYVVLYKLVCDHNCTFHHLNYDDIKTIQLSECNIVLSVSAGGSVADTSDMSSDPPSPTSTDPSPERCLRDPVFRPRPHPVTSLPLGLSATRSLPMSYAPMSPIMFAHAPFSHSASYRMSPYNYQPPHHHLMTPMASLSSVMTSSSVLSTSPPGGLPSLPGSRPSPVSPLQAPSFKPPELLLRGQSPPVAHVKTDLPTTPTAFPMPAAPWAPAPHPHQVSIGLH